MVSGKLAIGTAGSFESVTVYETLEQLTQYDVWIVVEDASAEHNLQAAPVKLVVQTSPAGPGNNMHNPHTTTCTF